ncbi:MAG: methyl-accepting chemotaxis protein [Chitinispirillia bacterium]|nr:methyl-accepting chemotaxis protein [Chitinispirillia bacterium]MCL2269700.1 methyl-accepting chemotaxis protein [Chitinispirillia bacterium]
MKLGTKVTVWITLTVIVSALGVGISIALKSQETLVNSILREKLNATETNALMLSTLLNGHIDVLMEVANRPLTQTMDVERMRPVLLQDIPRISGVLDLGILSPEDGLARYIKGGDVGQLGDRDYVKEALAGKPALRVLFSRITGQLVAVYAVPIFSNESRTKVAGVLIARKDGIKTLSDETNNLPHGMKTAYAFLVDRTGTMMAHKDTKMVLDQFNPITASEKDTNWLSMAGMIRTALAQKKGGGIYHVGKEEFVASYAEVPGYPWLLFTGAAASEVNGYLDELWHYIGVLLAIFIVSGIIVSYFMGLSIALPLKKCIHIAKEIANGNTNIEIKVKARDKSEIGVLSSEMSSMLGSIKMLYDDSIYLAGEGLEGRLSSRADAGSLKGGFAHIIGGMNNVFEAVAAPINESMAVMDRLAHKDLTARMDGSYKGEFAKMKENLNTVVQNLDDAMSQVSEAATQVSAASGEISSVAQGLAEGSNVQASSLEEVSSSLEEMSSMTKQNADNSNQAKVLATEARNAANEGDAAMKTMANAINQIKQSSDNTAKIVKTIDDIAFQTNLLALNAAVEAARAGEAGKGFAVVAEEVRNLAMRSAEAAKSTTEMIEESVKNAEGGVKITEEVARSLEEIVDRVGKVGDLISDIAAASSEQAHGIKQVNDAVMQMNSVTQQNAANSEESASASEELSSQASELANMVSAFNLSINN